jgi:hypothetical protein
LDTASTTREKSNLKLRSNLFPKRGNGQTRLEYQISGAAALKKYLMQIAPGADIAAAARQHLLPWQQAQLAYELPCSECGGIPEGPVRTSKGVEVEFRCPRGQCGNSRGFSLTVDLSIELVQQVSQRIGGDVFALIGMAFCDYSQVVGQGSSPSAPTIQRPIRVTRTQHYLYSIETLPRVSAIANACVLKLLEQ